MDREALLWVVTHRLRPLNAVFVDLGLVGSAGLLWIALAAVLAPLARRSIRFVVIFTAGTVWVADLLAFGIKAAVSRPRPFQAIPSVVPLVEHTAGSSFPSGHAATSFAGAIALAWLLPRLRSALIVLAALVAFSRVYVGVHYPSDVLAGAVIGATIGLLAVALVRGRYDGDAAAADGSARDFRRRDDPGGR